MKKIFLFLTAAALMAVGCNKSEFRVDLPEGKNSDELTIRPMSSKMTKAGELAGISMPNTYGIYAAATQRNAGGIIENASFFSAPFEQLFGTNEADPSGIGTSSAAADSRLWHAGTFAASAFSPVPMYWPIGGVKLDFLAYALPMAEHQETGLNTGVWSATWDNAATDAASQVSFYDVNTYANQIDVLYAVANGQTNSANGGPDNSTAMAFKHAQSLLIFNIKVNEAASGVLTVNDIEFINDERLAALQQEQYSGTDPGALTDIQTTLKSIGDFSVNNARNDVVAGWSNLASSSANYRMPVGAHAEWAAANASYVADHAAWQLKKDAHDAWQAKAQTYSAWEQKKLDDDYANMNPEDKAAWDTANPEPENPGMEPEAPGVEPQPAGDEPAADGVSNSNSVVLAQTDADLFQDYGLPIIYHVDGTTPEYAQLGETLMIPQQEKVNFVIKYTLNGKTMYFKYNDLRGVWESGKKYIYNLDITMNEIVISESVDDWTAAPVNVPIM